MPEVLDRLGISRATLLRWESAGIAPKRRLVGPNTVAYLEAEIDSFMASRPAFGESLDENADAHEDAALRQPPSRTRGTSDDARR
jgi:predicted DNA-binding transcriptional regulator AlpA